MRFAKLAVVCLYATLALAAVAPGSAAGAFGFSSFDVEFQDPYGDSAPDPSEIGARPSTTQAGGRVDLVTSFTFNTAPGPITDETLKDIEVDLPPGLFGDFSAVPDCTTAKLVELDGFCNPAAQVGVLIFDPGKPPIRLPVYKMATGSDEAGVLGVNFFGALVKVDVTARSEEDHGLRVTIRNLNQGAAIFGMKLVIWGVPADPVNDPNRFGPGGTGISAQIEPAPLLSLPPRCDAPLVTTVHADSWQHPGRRQADGSADLSDPSWVSVSDDGPTLIGCDALDFQPSLKARPTADRADVPTGLDVDLEVPQRKDPEGLATAHVRDVVVRLPEGLVVNPAAANGLAVCNPAQIGLTSATGSGRPSFDSAPADCPAAARIGTASVEASGIADPLSGPVFVADPYRNPFGDLLSVYAVVEGHGVRIKLAGRVSADPRSGRLEISFEEAPQLAFESLELDLFGGPLAPLSTPAACGEYATTATITPWSAPDSGPPATSVDRYAIRRGPPSSGCAPSAGLLPLAPAFEAGAVAPIAGARTPFVVNLRRGDGTRRFSALSFSPPPGLIARLAGTASCADGTLAVAATRTGTEEGTAPSCPTASEIGHVHIAAGVGPTPYNVSGKVYLAGPYKGAPLSLAAVVPALAGPFDLGTIVVRSALDVDPRTARISARSDPFPTLLKGIPLDLRSISLRLDKPGFTINPTSCDPATVDGALFPVIGDPVGLSDRFQVAECGRLGFKPRLALKLSGPTHRSAYPKLRVVVTMPRHSRANLAEVALTLPKTEYLASTHIGAICGRADYASESCPARSVRGRAKVWSPLLDQPLSGPVYLRSSDRPLPDLVASLDGQIHLDLEGRIDSDRARLRSSFSAPDVPISKVVLTLKGGRKGLLVNNSELCRARPRAAVEFTGHNGKQRFSKPLVKADCGKRQ